MPVYDGCKIIPFKEYQKNQGSKLNQKLRKILKQLLFLVDKEYCLTENERVWFRKMKFSFCRNPRKLSPKQQEIIQNLFNKAKYALSKEDLEALQVDPTKF